LFTGELLSDCFLSGRFCVFPLKSYFGRGAPFRPLPSASFIWRFASSISLPVIGGASIESSHGPAFDGAFDAGAFDARSCCQRRYASWTLSKILAFGSWLISSGICTGGDP